MLSDISVIFTQPKHLTQQGLITRLSRSSRRLSAAVSAAGFQEASISLKSTTVVKFRGQHVEIPAYSVELVRGDKSVSVTVPFIASAVGSPFQSRARAKAPSLRAVLDAISQA